MCDVRIVFEGLTDVISTHELQTQVTVYRLGSEEINGYKLGCYTLTSSKLSVHTSNIKVNEELGRHSTDHNYKSLHGSSLKYSQYAHDLYMMPCASVRVTFLLTAHHISTRCMGPGIRLHFIQQFTLLAAANLCKSCWLFLCYHSSV